MIITCPSCATRYGVDATVFPSEGRRVKCANCGNRWHAIGETDLNEAVAPMDETAWPQSDDDLDTEPEPVAEDHGSIHAIPADDRLPDEASVPDDFAGTDPIDSADLAVDDDSSENVAASSAIIARDPAEAIRRSASAGDVADDLEAGAQFVADGDEEFDAIAAEIVDQGRPAAARRRPQPSTSWKKRLKRGRAGGQPSASPMERAQAVAIGAMLCGLALLVFNREAVVEAAPQMASLYATAGFPVNTRGIEFAAVRADFATQSGIPVMRISGRMHNVSTQDRRLSAIRLSLLDDTGREIYHWTTDAGQGSLEAGSNLPFQSILTSPPSGASGVAVRFADAG